jgi:hypothetical protein
MLSSFTALKSAVVLTVLVGIVSTAFMSFSNPPHNHSVPEGYAWVGQQMQNGHIYCRFVSDEGAELLALCPLVPCCEADVYGIADT